MSNHPVPIWPEYKARIRNNATGEIRERQMGVPWYDHSLFWWTEGNFSCDCNREWEFQRAGKEQESEEPVCGDTRYSVLDVLFPDGSGLVIDGEDAGVGEASHEVRS